MIFWLVFFYVFCWCFVIVLAWAGGRKSAQGPSVIDPGRITAESASIALGVSLKLATNLCEMAARRGEFEKYLDRGETVYRIIRVPR